MSGTRCSGGRTAPPPIDSLYFSIQCPGGEGAPCFPFRGASGSLFSRGSNFIFGFNPLPGPQWAPKTIPGAAQGSRTEPGRPRARFPPMFPQPSLKPEFEQHADSIGRAQGFERALMGDGRKCSK